MVSECGLRSSPEASRVLRGFFVLGVVGAGRGGCVRFLMALRALGSLPSCSLSLAFAGNDTDMKSTTKAAAEIAALARKHSKAAIRTLAQIMKQADGPATARVSAAQALLDRGCGKAAQFVAAEAQELPLFARVERVIVDPRQDGGGKGGGYGEQTDTED